MGPVFAVSLVIALLLAEPLSAQVPSELRGRVTDARTSRPVADARIELAGREEAGRSDANGVFVIRSLEPREYAVRIRAFGYLPREVIVQVANTRTAVIDVALEPSTVTLRAMSVQAARDTQNMQAIVFDRASIEKSARRDLGELLQSTPGVVITQAGGAGAETHVSIRGSGANEVLVLVDGVPINSVMSGTADLSRISLESVERVTLLTGAQSARYGGRALAGVIEIETRRATDELSALVRTGAWGERDASATLGHGDRVGAQQFSGSITGDYRSIRGDFPFTLPAIRGGGTATRVNSDVTSRQLSASTSLEDDAGGERVRASWEDLSRGLAGSVVQPSITGRQSNAQLSAGVDARREQGWLSWIGAADITQERTTFIDPSPPFGTAYNDSVHATGMTASLTGTIGGAASSASLGTELRTLDVTSNELAPDAPHWQRLLGVFASYRFAHLIDAMQSTLGGDAGLRLDESSLSGSSVVSPHVGATLSHGIVAASISLGGGYAPPTLADQFFHEGVLVKPNPSLQPERTTGDLEGRLTIRDVDAGPFVLSGAAAAYRANIDGMILWFPDFRFIWSPSNFDVHRAGWELSGDAALPALRADVQGTFNHTDVTYEDTVLSGQVVYRPQVTASVTLVLAPDAGRFELANRYVGERRTVAASSLNTLDPYWLTDARWTSSFTRDRVAFDLTFGLENLFDRPAAMLVDYPFPGRTWMISVRARHSPLI